jgi:hypothetical protein
MVLKFMDKIGNSHVGFFYFSYSIHYFFKKKLRYLYLFTRLQVVGYLLYNYYLLFNKIIYIYIYIYILNDKILNVTHVCVYYVNIEKKYILY